jgi:phage tail sheath protein FI
MPVPTLSAGVYTEEVSSPTGITTSVSPSTLGIVGYTSMGPSNVATLVTSYGGFVNTFGDVTELSYTAYAMKSFFDNGGQRAYVVRVTSSDAASGKCFVQSQITNKAHSTPGVTGTYILVSTTPPTPNITTAVATKLFTASGGASVVPGSVSLSWRSPVASINPIAPKARDGVAALTLALNCEFALASTNIPAYDPNFMAVIPGTVVLSYVVASGTPATHTVPAPPFGSTISTVVTETVAGFGTYSFDYASGKGSIQFSGATIPDPGTFTIGFTPTSETNTVMDDGTGSLTGAAITGGTINYVTGDFNFGLTDTSYSVHDQGLVLASYKVNAFQLAPSGAGSWNQNIRVSIQNSDPLLSPLNDPSSFTFTIQLADSNGNYHDRETYDSLSFTDSTASNFFPSVINSLSSLVSVTLPAGDIVPWQLVGTKRTVVLGGGDQSAGNKTFGTTLTGLPILPGSVQASYTPVGSTKAVTFTDNSQGSFAGSAVSSGSVAYDTGVLSFVTASAIKAGTLVSLSYRTSPVETIHYEVFGDQTKQYWNIHATPSPAAAYYDLGTDGTFGTNYGEAQLTSSSLQASFSGLYALDKVQEIMQVCVPDSGGDPIMTGDLIAYVEKRPLTQANGGDRFAILCPPKGTTKASAVVSWLQNLGQRSMFSAIYWPWIAVPDPIAANVGTGARTKIIPPTAAVAGVFARTDVNRNVSKAPAGTTDGALRGVVGLEYNVTVDDANYIYPRYINPLVNWTQTGLVVWGARTFAADQKWRYIQARRLFMFVESSVWSSMFWTVFENNGPELWIRIKSQLNGFLGDLFRQGYFAGTSANSAFYVICDESNNTPQTIAQGKVIVDVGIAPTTPAEFITIRYAQITNAS